VIVVVTNRFLKLILLGFILSYLNTYLFCKT